MLPSPCIELDSKQQRELLAIARRSIAQGFATAAPLRLPLAALTVPFSVNTAVFVTLTQNGALRGCIGALQARQPLAQAVAAAAFGSAFSDPRFEPLQRADLESVQIEISVLSPLQSFDVDSRTALLQSLRRNVDGLVIEDQGKRATFLPKVWDKIATPAAFVEELMVKAGLPADHWSNSIRVQRYSTLTFADI